VDCIKSFFSAVVRLFRAAGRYIVWSNPRIYRAVGLAKRRFPKDFDENHHLFILGFPRSSNTYCGHYLRATQPAGFKVLFQLHFPPLAIEALRREVPHIMVIRNPRESALSFAILLGKGVAAQLDYYIDYHRSLLAYRDRLFVVRFEDSTTRFRAVLEEARRRFSIQLDLSMSAEESETRTRDAIRAQALHEDGTVNLRYYNLPSEERAQIARGLESQFLEPRVAARLRAAEALHQRFLEYAVDFTGSIAGTPGHNVAPSSSSTGSVLLAADAEEQGAIGA
jgi:hypothetical protein